MIIHDKYPLRDIWSRILTIPSGTIRSPLTCPTKAMERFLWTGHSMVQYLHVWSTYNRINNAHQFLSQSTNHPTWLRTDESSHIPNRPWNYVPLNLISVALTTGASFDQSDQTPWSIIHGSGRPSLPMIRSHTAFLVWTHQHNTCGPYQ